MKIAKTLFKKLKETFNWFKKKSLPLKIIFIAALLFIGWLAFSKISSSKNKVIYQTAKVEKGSIISSVTASGQVLAVNIMSANTKASGIVKAVYVKDGDIVQKGDKILEIDLDFQGQQKNAQAWTAYLAAKNNLESAKITLYTLQSEMFSKWDSFYKLSTNSTYQNSDGTPNFTNRALPEFHISEKNWLAAEAKYKNQQAVISQAEAALNTAWLDYLQTSSTVTAPTDGMITSLMYVEGMSIGSLDTGTTTSNQQVATIKTQGNPIVSVNLSEIDVSRVKPQQKAIITFDSLTDKTFSGQVIGVNRIGQTSSGVTQYPSIIKLDTSTEEILPNMTVTAKIIIDKKDGVLLVPLSAIQTENNQTYVQKLINEKPQITTVEIGLSSDSQVEIVTGLSEGEIVITETIQSTRTNSQQSSSPFGGFGTFRMTGGRRD